jgi:3-(3-hydroxy-phenyl)propionate hydroxylase
MPDLDLVAADGPRRVFELLHDARPVLLDLGAPAPGHHPLGGPRQRIEADYEGAWELRSSAPSALRPPC